MSVDRWRGGVRRWMVLIGVVLAAFALAPVGSVSAHAVVDEISPADGSLLAGSPHEIIVDFSEAVRLDSTEIELTSTALLPPEPPVAALDPDDPSRLIVTMPALADGTHRVRITTRDSEDLHEVVARTSFSIGDVAPAPSAPVVAPPEYPEAAARWVFAAALALLVGVLAVRSSSLDVVMLAVRHPDRLRATAAWSIAALVAARLAMLAARAVAVGGDLDQTFDAVLGTGEARRFGFVAVASACLVPLAFPLRALWLDMPVRMGRRLTVRLALGWIGVIWLSLLASWGDHSALNGGVEVGTALAKAAHFLGLGLWVGVMVVLLVISGKSHVRTAMAAMSDVAVFGALLAVASGLLLTSRLVVSITALFATGYGQMLAVKSGVVVLVALIGLSVVRGRATSRVRFEVGGFACVMALGVMMATAGPAIDEGFAEAGAPPPQEVAAVRADDLLVQVRAIPGRPGLNTLEVRVNDTRRPAPAPIGDVVVQVVDDTMLTPFRVRPDEDGLAFVEDVVLPAGRTEVVMRVEREHWRTARADGGVSTTVDKYRHPVLVSSRRIGSAAMLAGLCVIGAALMVVLRHRRAGRLDSSTTGHDDPRHARKEPTSCLDDELPSQA